MCRRPILLISVFLVLGLAVPSAQAQWISSVVRTGNSTQPEPGIALDPLTERWHDLAGWHGSVCYNNRTHIYASVPTEILGAQYVQVSNADKNTTDYTLTLTMSTDATLYLFLDNRLGNTGGGQGVDPIIPAQMSWVTTLGFSDTGVDMGIDENADGSINNYFSVFSKQVEAGDVIALGVQNDGGGRNMYAVAAMPIAASNPSPANGAMDVPTNVMLSWTPASGAISHDIYFGTNPTPGPPEYKTTVTDPTYTPPGGLAYGTTYYWRIDEYDGTTTYPGNIWTFTTKGQGEGNILFEYFWGTDSSLETLLNLPTFPDNPDQSELRTNFEGLINWRDNYGTHVRGYLYPPQTGNYTFWIASDDQSQLWLSTDEDPAHAVQIASVPGWTPSRDFDNKGGGVGGPEQMSSEIALEAGSRYYIEALHSEGGGGDNLAVAWQGPSLPTRAVISGTFLSPWITFKAANPSPGNGATDVPTDVALNWTPGSGAISHHIYFGTNQADVVSGTGGTDKGTQIETTYTPGVLAYGTTYYWRIDEFDGATTYTGNIWSFTTTAISIPTNTSVGTWDPVTRTYTLTQDVTGSIRIDEDNLTLDGAGHRVVGPGSGDGVALFGRTGVTVKNLNIQSFGNGIYIGNSSGNTLTGNTTNLNGRGIALDYSENNTLEGNNSESNTGPAINLWHSSGNNLTGNTNNSNGVGISLDNSTANTLTGNVCESNAWCGIAIHDSSNGNTLNNNTCNSSTDYDGIGLYNSTGNTLTGNICESNKRAGIWLENSTGNTITTNTCSSNNGAGINLWGSSNNNNLIGNTNNSNNVGIDLHACDNNTLEGNNSELNTWAGINLYYSNGSTLTGNTNNSNNRGINLDHSAGNILNGNIAELNTWAGINLGNSNGNGLTGNTNNSHNVGICLDYSISNNLTGNICNSNSWAGIRLYSSENNTLTGNTNNLNGNGINLENSTGNTLTRNTNNSNNVGINLYNSSNGNTIYNNNFISNNGQAYVDGSSSGNVFNLDKPTGGNFWSDWTTPDADHDGFVDSPYIFAGGQDNLSWIRQDYWLSADSDGVSDGIEDGAPNGGDGNSDGILDSAQDNVASLLNAVDQEYVTIVSEVGTLENVSATADPPATVPAGVEFPIGFFAFTVSGISPGGSTTVTLLLPAGHTVGTYYKYGPEPGNETPHWYEFLWDGTTGAEILTDRIILHFVDGQRGDNDLTEPGQIVDPGAPAAKLVQAVDHLVSVSCGLVGYDRRTGQFSTNVTVTNTSSTTIDSPVWLVIESISPPEVTLANPDGTTDGKPYFDLSGLLGNGQLDPGEAISKRIYFDNPNRLRFTFKPSVRGVILP
jgi:parallel beta-helix repeat protein